MRILGACGACAVIFASSLALADGKADKALTDKLLDLAQSQVEDGTSTDAGFRPMRFAFMTDYTLDAPAKYPEAQGATGHTEFKKTVVGWAADHQAGWLTADGDEYDYCGDDSCAKMKPSYLHHVTLLFDGGQPIAWHDDRAISDKDQAKALAAGVTLTPLTRKIDGGAADAAQLFESSIGDAKALAATVSTRKDVVLFGSAPGERFVGGAAVAAQLTKWGLTMKVRDGVRAGTTKSGTLAWVAALVDAKVAKNPKAKPAPYRALFIYEKGASGWQVVVASFSFIATEGSPPSDNPCGG